MLRGRLNDLYLYEVKARGEQRFSGESFKGVVKGFTAAGSRKPESYNSCKSIDGTAVQHLDLSQRQAQNPQETWFT